jgi:hypothetical protein
MAYSDRLKFEGGAGLSGATIHRNLMGFLDAFKAAASAGLRQLTSRGHFA